MSSLIIKSGGNRARVKRVNTMSFRFDDILFTPVTTRTWKLLTGILLLYVSFVWFVWVTYRKFSSLCGETNKFSASVAAVFFGQFSDSKSTDCLAFATVVNSVRLLLTSAVGIVLYARLTTTRKRYHTVISSPRLWLHRQADDWVLSCTFYDTRSRQLLRSETYAFYIDANLNVAHVDVKISGSLLTGLRIDHIVNSSSPLHGAMSGSSSEFPGQLVFVVCGDDPRSGPVDIRRAFNTYSLTEPQNLWRRDGQELTVDYSMIN